MRKLILLAAVAATIVPTAAIARERNPVRTGTAQMRNDRRVVRANRQVVRSDRRVAAADRRVVRQDRRAMVADRHVARHDRRIVANRIVTNRVRYVAPIRNWSYRPVNIGYQLRPDFYGSRYYISDYGRYHLSSPHHRLERWIRYGDDLLLVNIRTGRVLRVIHYRYW